MVRQQSRRSGESYIKDLRAAEDWRRIDEAEEQFESKVVAKPELAEMTDAPEPTPSIGLPSDDPSAEEEEEWLPLTAYPGYERTKGEPWRIRKTGLHLRIMGTRELSLNLNQENGYLYVSMPNPTPGHIVIERQFIPNPDNYRYIDHKSRQKLDNRIENLRWVSSSTNACSKTKTKGVIHQ